VIRRLWRRAGGRDGSAAKALVLGYHRVGDPAGRAPGLCVAPERFAAHCALLRDTCRPVPLEAVAAEAALRDPRPAVAVTFDDGYADNLAHALPVLERFGIPATIFVITGTLDRPAELWWDRLARVLLSAPLPDRLPLAVAGEPVRWDVSAALAAEGGPRQARLALYRVLTRALRRMSGEERDRVVEALRVWAGVAADPLETDRALTPDEVRRIDAGGLVHVGAHTVTHPVLPALPVATQRREIEDSRARLETLLGRPVDRFAYPYGEHDGGTAELARQAGFAWACSTVRLPVRPGTDPLALPRCMVVDQDGGALAQRLPRWLRLAPP